MKSTFFKKHFTFRKSNTLLKYLIALDIFFILFHVMLVCLIFFGVQIDSTFNVLFRLEYDNSYPEIFQYLKYAIVIGFILTIIYKKKRFAYFPLLFVFIFMLFDDALRIHEKMGAWFVDKFNLPAMYGLRGQDFGELIFVAIFGSIFMLTLILAFYYGDRKFRKTNIDIGLLFSFLLFFGIVVDMIPHFGNENKIYDLFKDLLEDGGEMIAMSIMAWYFFFLTLRPKNHDAFLHNYFYDKMSFLVNKNDDTK